MHVLFVCTGNICRSPTAERLALAYAEEGGLELTASSAGTHGLTGHAMDPTAAMVLTQLGGSPDGFLARRITPRIADDADLVLTMTERHRDAVLALSPRKLRTTFTLLEAVALVEASGATTVPGIADARARHSVGVLDIEDPYRRETDLYEEVGQQISDALPTILRLA
ncbi:MAG: low molecular weight phosphatase family protein [Rhodococcus sp. (in: high G+C Gram-positive bacteria)]